MKEYIKNKRIGRKSISFLCIQLLCISVFFQSLCFSGILAYDLVCTCDHASSKEVHGEDFSLSKTIQKSKSHCHSLNKHESHRCTCKKKDIRKNAIASLFQINLILPQSYLFLDSKKFTDFNSLLFIFLSEGFYNQLIKPPAFV